MKLKKLSIDLLDQIVTTDLGKGIKQFLKLWMFPGVHWAPSFWNRISLEPLWLFPELAILPNSVTRPEGVKEPNDHCNRALKVFCRDKTICWKDNHFRTTISGQDHQSGLDGRMSRQKPFLSKTLMADIYMTLRAWCKRFFGLWKKSTFWLKSKVLSGKN